MIPFFSVVIPLYNKESYIYNTLKSVVNQSFQDFEVIIINDGSTDNSVKVVKNFKDSRIKIYNQTNQGLSRARNSGIKKAKGNYLVFIDADDFWLKHHLEQLFDLVGKYPNKGLYCTGYTIQKSKSVFHRAHFNDLPENFIGIVPDFFKHSLQNCIAWISAICIPKNIFNAIGNFDPEIFSEQDTDLYIRIALKFDIVLDNTSVSAVYNRMMDDGLSNAQFKKQIPKLVYTYKDKEVNHPSLKRFIDLNRFALAIQFKLALNTQFSNILLNDIDLKNMNFWQKLLLYLPSCCIKLMFYLKNKFYINSLFLFKPKG